MDLSRDLPLTYASGALKLSLSDASMTPRVLYREAWNLATDDEEKCVAAHYPAHLEPDAEKALNWNLTALSHARLADPDLVVSFLPSLYVNLGRSYELLGDNIKSTHYYELAAQYGLVHQA